MSHHDLLGVATVQDNLLDETLPGHGGDFRVEGQDEQRIEAGGCKKPFLLLETGQDIRGVSRQEKLPGMRLERHQRRGAPALARLFYHPRHDARVAPMDSVEAADSQHQVRKPLFPHPHIGDDLHRSFTPIR